MKFSIIAASIFLVSIPSLCQGDLLVGHSTRNDTSLAVGPDPASADNPPG